MSQVASTAMLAVDATPARRELQSKVVGTEDRRESSQDEEIQKNFSKNKR